MHCIEKQGGAQSNTRVFRVGARQKPCAGECANHDAEHHQPKPFHHAKEIRPRNQLPNIGDKGWNNQQSSCADGRHDRTENTHSDGRQSHPRHALDDPGEEERQRDN
jgi:hypothetical protein